MMVAYRDSKSYLLRVKDMVSAQLDRFGVES